MGQQQLILVILVSILVGIATVVAFNTFSSASESANLDAVRQDIATIASSAQSYFMKPKMLYGGGNSFYGITFKNLAFPANEIDSTGLIAVNENGHYTITEPSANSSTFSFIAIPASSVKGSLTITAPTVIGQSFTATVNQEGLIVAVVAALSN